MGHSLFIMLLANPNLNITTIDIDATYAIPSVEVLRKKFPNANIKFIHKDSLQALNEIDEKFDLFHIDGHHENSRIKQEFELCKKLNDGDIMNIVFDDFEWFKEIDLQLSSEYLVLEKEVPQCDWTNTYFKLKIS